MQSIIEVTVRTIRRTTFNISPRSGSRGGAVAQEEKVSVPPEAIYVLVVVRAVLVASCTFVE